VKSINYNTIKTGIDSATNYSNRVYLVSSQAATVEIGVVWEYLVTMQTMQAIDRIRGFAVSQDMALKEA
jgi:hypothetical protein